MQNFALQQLKYIFKCFIVWESDYNVITKFTKQKLNKYNGNFFVKKNIFKMPSKNTKISEL